MDKTDLRIGAINVLNEMLENSARRGENIYRFCRTDINLIRKIARDDVTIRIFY